MISGWLASKTLSSSSLLQWDFMGMEARRQACTEWRKACLLAFGSMTVSLFSGLLLLLLSLFLLSLLVIGVLEEKREGRASFCMSHRISALRVLGRVGAGFRIPVVGFIIMAAGCDSRRQRQ